MTALSNALLLEELRRAGSPDDEAAKMVRNRVEDILRPPGALARFDELAIWLGGWQRSSVPTVNNSVAFIFAGDHGVTVDGVSAYPPEVTGAMLTAFQQRRASVSAIASVSGTRVYAVDVGVGDPTGNIRVEPAMNDQRFVSAFGAGRSAVARCCDADETVDLLIVGEMGIGNTTAAAAVSAALDLLNPIDAERQESVEITSYVGSGTGIADVEYRNKVRVVAEAVSRLVSSASVSDGSIGPLEILRQLGGTELAAMTGALVEARIRSLPVLLDGFIATVPAAILHAIDPAFVANARSAHVSAEPGHQLLLDRLELAPLLSLDRRLGEVSGAVAAVPLLQMACRLVTDVPTFTEWFGSPS